VALIGPPKPVLTDRGFLRHVQACNLHDPRDYVPLLIGGAAVGRVRRDTAERLTGFSDLFAVEGETVVLQPSFATFETRSQALDEAVGRLIEAGVVAKRRNELYPVAPRFTDAPLAQLDRGAVATFGVRSYGVHVNGATTRGAGRMLQWIGVRAQDKLVAPGKLDNIVAGGQPIGLTLTENLVKECAEEAQVGETQARRAKPVGAISYAMAVPEGLRADTLFVFDMDIGGAFTPRNTDGEIERFELMPTEEIIERVRTTDDFKFNVNLVIIDYLIREGLIGAEHPEYLDLIGGLHRDHPAT
jgi:hypothetical protein